MPHPTCSVAICDRPVLTAPYCSAHYAYWRRTGKFPTHPVKPRQSAICTVPRCERPTRRNGMCETHDGRMKRTGSVQADKPFQVHRKQPEVCIEPGCSDRAKTHSRCMTHFSRWWRYEADRDRNQIDSVDFWVKVDRSSVDGCWEWMGPRHRNRYGQVSGFATPKLSHRIAWEMTYGPISGGQFVCHRCDNPPCCRPDHLFLGTHQENMDDMKAKGRSDLGPRSPRRIAGRKLDWDKVDAIRAILETGVSYSEVARRYGVTQSVVSRIGRGLSWNPARRSRTS